MPRNSRPNPFKARGRSLILLGTAGLAVLGTTALSTLGTAGAGSFGTAVQVGVFAASVVINAAVVVFAFRFATTRRLSNWDVVPGAIAAALAWQLLQTFGIVYVGHVVKNASPTNGVFALVLGMLAFLYITATVVVLCVEINVVRVDRLHPRALLTPFTDNVELTRGDEKVYADAARSQSAKGFEQVEVHFDPPPRKDGSGSTEEAVPQPAEDSGASS